MKKKPTIEDYLQVEYCDLIADDPLQSNFTTEYLKSLGYFRKVRISSPHTLSILQLLANTNLVATLPKRLVEHASKSLPLTFQSIPFKMDDVPIVMNWHEQFNNDPGHQWLRDTIRSLLGVRSLQTA